MIRHFSAIAAIIWGILGIVFSASGQKDTLRREVEVVKAFTPTAIDAEKILENPVIKADETRKPDFSYSIDSKPVFSVLSVKTMQAATVVGKPAEEPGYGLVRAGVGNYNKPYGELFFNNTKNKNSIFGIHAMHLSSHSKLTLANGDRVKAPFSDNEAELFLKHMFRKSTLSVNLGVDHSGFRYYGYPGNAPSDSIPAFIELPDQDYGFQGAKQTFTRGGIHLSLKNIYATRKDPSAGFDFAYYRFGVKTGQREDFARFSMDFNRPHEGFSLLLNAGFEYSGVSQVYSSQLEMLPIDGIVKLLPDTLKNTFLHGLTSRKQTWLFFKPAIYIGNETINLKAGFKSWIVGGKVDKAAFKIAPDVRFNFSPVKEIINVFAGVDGEYYHNHYSAIAEINPFVDPELSVRNYLEKYRVFGGFDGKLSTRTNFKIQVDYSASDDHPFYYLQGFKLPAEGPLPGPQYVDNTFKVLYDDLKTTRFNGEITHYAGDKLNLLFSANVYKYTLTIEKKPWNMPSFDATVSLNYAVNDRFNVSADLYAIGNRTGLVKQYDIPLGVLSPEIREYPLTTAFDINQSQGKLCHYP